MGSARRAGRCRPRVVWATACNVILRLGAVVVVIWDVIFVVIEITVPLVSPVFVSRGSRSLRRARRFKTEVSDDPGYARREARSGYRRPRTQPSRTYGSPMPERLAESMRCSGRTPIEHYRHRWRIVAFWRAARLNLLPTTTIPKSAFTLADWRYEPIASTELAAGQPYCGGFILSVRLHRNENRQHLRRSLMTGRRRSRRLVVIASAGDMFQPQAWVRCLVVNAETLNLPDRVRGHAVLRVTDPGAQGGPVVYRRRQKDVPDDAVWLMVPASNYCQPAEEWGDVPERLGQHTRVAVEPAAPDCEGVDDDDYVRKWAATYRKVTVALWALLGPGVLIIALLFILLAHAIGQGETPQQIALAFWAVYLLLYGCAVASASASLTVQAATARTWRCREGQLPGEWKGGTGECLIMGDLLRRGPSLGPKQWNEYCTDSVPLAP